MLEKKIENEKIVYCDSHFHLSDCMEKNCFDNSEDIIACSCFHAPSEWETAFSSVSDKNFLFGNNAIIRSFGLHPQNPDLSFLPFLESLLNENKIQAIGECGFDFYKPFLTQFKKIQEDAFSAQIELAKKHNKPVVIHCRKANEKLFEYSKELKKLPSVLFHSFMGTPSEVKSLLNHGINGYFSFGKQIFNGNKKTINCVKELPIERLLLETDAPFQTLKGEEKTFSSEIKKVYIGAFKLRYCSENIECPDFYDFADKLKYNFTACFCNPL